MFSGIQVVTAPSGVAPLKLGLTLLSEPRYRCNRTFGCGSFEAALEVITLVLDDSCNRTFGCGSFEAKVWKRSHLHEHTL